MQDLNVFVSRHREYIRAALRHLGVPRGGLDDAQQEVFLVLVRRRSAFDPSRGSARQWIWGICRNIAAAGHRARRRHLSSHTGSEPSARPPMEERIAAGQCLGVLDPEARALWLARQEGCTAAELADRTGLPVTTIQWRLRRVRLRLQQWTAHAARECRCVFADLFGGVERHVRGFSSSAATVFSATLLSTQLAAAPPAPSGALGEFETRRLDRTLAAAASDRADVVQPLARGDLPTMVATAPDAPRQARPAPAARVRTERPRVRHVREPSPPPAVTRSGRVRLGEFSVVRPRPAAGPSYALPEHPRPRRRAL